MSETKLYRVWWVYTCDDLSRVEVIPMTAEQADDVRKRFQKPESGAISAAGKCRKKFSLAAMTT